MDKEYTLVYCGVCEFTRQHRLVPRKGTNINICVECCENDFKYITTTTDIEMMMNFVQKKINEIFITLSKENISLDKANAYVNHILKNQSDKFKDLLQIESDTETNPQQ